MKTLLYLVALVWGGAVVYRGIAEGMPTPPLDAKEWGGIVAFGLGVLAVLVSLRHFWNRLADNDAPLGRGTTALLIVLSIAATVGAMSSSKRPAKDQTDDCLAIIHHIHSLAIARDPSPESRARFDQLRPMMMRSCKQMPSEKRRCVLATTAIEAVQRCD